MRIGAKTITAFTLLAASGLPAGYLGRLRADYLAQLDPWASFAVAAFAVVAANAVFHFGRLGASSEHHLRIGLRESPRVERADPFGRSPGRKPRWWRRTRGALMRSAYVAIFLMVGLATIDNRGMALLAAVSQLFAPSAHSFCRDGPAPEREDPQLAGCGLLRRAYALGYAKDLGPCAPREQEAEADICYRRQLDEPYLHYAWRLLNARGAHLFPDVVAGVSASIDGINERRNDLDDLWWAQADAVTQTPRASHHLFTNLPSPRDRSIRGLVEALDAAACDRRTVSMPPLVDVRGQDHAPSLVLEHAMGHLLFNPAYPTVVASCREHTIHWGAPPDACDQVVGDPVRFLASRGRLDEVRAVVRRHGRAKLLATLAAQEGKRPAPPRPPQPSRLVSFQCFMVGAPASGARPSVHERSTVIDGRRYAVRELRVARSGVEVRDQIQVFLSLSRLLAPGFTYGSLQSAQSVADVDGGRAAAQRFARRGDLLTKLDLLRETDIFLGHEWIDTRPDLLAVYPYHVHLRNFVEAFRRHYQHARDRL